MTSDSWIDGKPIYRNRKITNITVSTPLIFDYIIKIYEFLKRTSDGYTFSPENDYMNSLNSVKIYFLNNYNCLEKNNNFDSSAIIVEYIKL